MYAYKFWKTWHRNDQYFFSGLALLLILCIGYFWYAYLASPAPTLVWDRYQELQSSEITLRTFTVGTQVIPVTVDNFLLYEVLSGSELNFSKTTFYIFLFLFTLALVTLLSIITTLRQFWFLVGMGIFSLFAISLQLEALEIMGLTNKVAAAGIIVPVVGLAYYFHAFKTSAVFFTRLFSFGVLACVLGLAISYLSPVPDSLLLLAVNGYTIATILTLVFILMIGAEIPAAFINLLTQSQRQTKTLRHFLIITSAYLLNLLISYGIETGYLAWNLWVINFFFLFTVSAVLGIWGFRQREPQYEDILPANPLGVYLILSLAILSFATITVFVATAGDIVIEVIHDVVLYSHLGYGIIFLFYVISNFGSMLSQNLQVYKVLYKPNTMHYITFRIMGLITCFAFLVFDTSYRTVVDQLYAAYYNLQGDVYYIQGNDTVAEAYYNKSVVYRNQNHHAHYALATIQAARLEPQKVREEYTSAANGNPSEFAYMNLSEAYRQGGYAAASLEVLQEGVTKFPESGPLFNELGRAYAKLNMQDSALLSFQQARQSKITKEIAETNLLATSARFNVNYPADSLLQLLGSNKAGPQSNALALANQQQLLIEIGAPELVDTVLSATRAAFLCNYLINQHEKVDSTYVKQALELARLESNFYFKEPILMAAAQAWYAKGLVKKAFELGREIAYASGSGKYFNLLGLWALEQGNADIAANYLHMAADKGTRNALLYEALAHTEADSLHLALVDWDSLSQSHESSVSALAKTMIQILNTKPDQASSLPDTSKYLYLRYKVKQADTTRFKLLISTIKYEPLQALAILDFTKKWYALDEPEIASAILSSIQGLKLNDKKIYDEIRLLNVMLLAETDIDRFSTLDLQEALPDTTLFINESFYLHALQAELNKNLDKARINYDYLARANPYFAEGLVASSSFFAADTTDRLKPYSILVSGLMMRPASVKLLKQYIKTAALLGFDDEADESLKKLKKLLPTNLFNQYIRENPDFFSIDQ